MPCNENQYLNILKELVHLAELDQLRPDRTGTGTYSLFGKKMEFDLSDMQIPMLTTKAVPFKTILHELYWMYILKNPDSEYLDQHNVKIWKEWYIPTKDSKFTVG